MKPLVYIESSVISYLTARASEDQIKHAWQIVTTRWWHTKMDTCHPAISPYVIEEVSAGDPDAAKLRLDAIRSLNVLDTNREIEALADFLLRTYAKLFQLGGPPKTVRVVRRGGPTTLGRFCVSPITDGRRPAIKSTF